MSFLPWSAILTGFLPLLSRLTYFRSVALFGFDFPSVEFLFCCALLARLLIHPVSVASRVARSTFRLSRFRCVAPCLLDFSSIPCPVRCALLARLSVCHVSVASHPACSTSRPSRVQCVARCSLDFSSVTFPLRRVLLVRLPVFLFLPFRSPHSVNCSPLCCRAHFMRSKIFLFLSGLLNKLSTVCRFCLLLH